MQISPCIIIPIYNNKDSIKEVVNSLESFGLPCLIIDDGSDAATRKTLGELESRFSWLRLIHRSENGGKGAAMADGFHAAHQSGYSHAIQLDADGQHDVTDIPHFLERAERCPDALVLGCPVFGEDAPFARRYGRWVTNIWVWIETFSTDIRDALCGYRSYPLDAVIKLYRKIQIGNGMVFDTEIAVRLFWEGVPMINVETLVKYPAGGISHFKYFKDNLSLTFLHVKLFVGMLVRIPKLVFRHRG